LGNPNDDDEDEVDPSTAVSMDDAIDDVTSFDKVVEFVAGTTSLEEPFRFLRAGSANKEDGFDFAATLFTFTSSNFGTPETVAITTTKSWDFFGAFVCFCSFRNDVIDAGWLAFNVPNSNARFQQLGCHILGHPSHIHNSSSFSVSFRQQHQQYSCKMGRIRSDIDSSTNEVKSSRGVPSEYP
jgi:hypothetical protein